MTVSVWDLNLKDVPLTKIHTKHTEFVTGLDFSNLIEDVVASTSWDSRLLIFPFMGEQPFIA